MTPSQTLLYFMAIFLGTAALCVVVAAAIWLCRYIGSVISCWRDVAGTDEVEE